MMRAALLAAVALGTVGCTLPPAYQPPAPVAYYAPPQVAPAFVRKQTSAPVAGAPSIVDRCLPGFAGCGAEEAIARAEAEAKRPPTPEERARIRAYARAVEADRATWSPERQAWEAEGEARYQQRRAYDDFRANVLGRGRQYCGPDLC